MSDAPEADEPGVATARMTARDSINGAGTSNLTVESSIDSSPAAEQDGAGIGVVGPVRQSGARIGASGSPDAPRAAARAATTAAPQGAQVAEEEFGAGIGTFHAFRYGDFRWLWVGNTFSSAAMWIQQTTMGWVAYD